MFVFGDRGVRIGGYLRTSEVLELLNASELPLEVVVPLRIDVSK